MRRLKKREWGVFRDENRIRGQIRNQDVRFAVGEIGKTSGNCQL
jgi:hypothetical protein